MKARFLIPFVVFVILVGFFFRGLYLKPREIPSPLIDKPAPAFNLPVLERPDQSFGPETLRGQVWMLNVWASWCVSCRDEHPVLVEYVNKGRLNIPLIGLNYKDQRLDAMRWLQQLGNPYQLSVVDSEGKIGIDYGVYGVPETYLIDKKGIIRYKHIGPVTPADLETIFLPKIQELSR